MVPEATKPENNTTERRDKRIKPPVKEINGIPLPDGLEIPGHWNRDLKKQIADEPFKDVRKKKREDGQQRSLSSPRRKDK